MGVSVRGLTKRFGPSPVVDGVSFDVPDGELLTIVGPSGSGKTTLLRCIAGVESPEAGSITIGSRLVYEAPGRVNVPTENRGIGMVSQASALWPHMTVKKNVSYPLEVRGDADADEKVSEVLSLLEMEGLAGRYPSEISGGEQQRVAIARAIVYRPSLVLLDEPFSSLDALLRESLRDDLRQLQLKLGMTMVYVTHDRVDALSLGDLTGVMSAGRLIAYGPPDSLLSSPPNSYTAKFLAGMLVLDADAESAPGGLRVKTELGAFDVPSSGGAGKAKLCIPPSACQIVGKGDATGVPGTVAGIARFPSGYLGVRISTGGGTIEVHSDSKVKFKPGDSVKVVFDPKRCFVLQE